MKQLIKSGKRRCWCCSKIKALTNFCKDKNSPAGYGYRCKECEKIRSKNRKLHKIYQITQKQYDEMLEKQKGVCAICGKSETAKRKCGVLPLAVDHCHKTGKIRGLLCFSCNARLGVLEDKKFNLKAKKYLKGY